MTAIRIIRPSDNRAMPWKNGLGTTAEIAIDPPHGDLAGGFRWRLSIASIERSCAFSAFPGYERTIMVIEGNGMELRVPGLPPRRMDRLYESFLFPGDTPADCRLLDGPIRDFNLMVDRARLYSTTAVHSWTSGTHALTPRASTIILHCFAGVADLTAGDVRATVEAGDTAILDADDRHDHRIELSVREPLTLSAMTLKPI